MFSTIRLPGQWQVAVTDLQMPLRYDNLVQSISTGTIDDRRYLFKVWVFVYLGVPDEDTKKKESLPNPMYPHEVDYTVLI